MPAAMHSPTRSPPQQLFVSPSKLLAAPFPIEDAMCALLTTVGDLTTTVASNQAYDARQIAVLTQLMQQHRPVTAACGPRRPEFKGSLRDLMRGRIPTHLRLHAVRSSRRTPGLCHFYGPREVVCGVVPR